MPNVDKKSKDERTKGQDKAERANEAPGTMAEMMAHCCGTGMMAKMANLMGCCQPSKTEEEAR